MALHEITQGVWAAETVLKISPGFRLPARMTVVEAAPGELLLYSPIKMDEALASEVEGLGDVRWIVAPNDFHHMFVGPALERFPQARAYGAPRALKQQSHVDWAGALDERIDDLPESAVPFFIDGMTRVNETVFWLPDAKTLVCSDLVLNVRNPEPWPARMVLNFLLDHRDRPSQGKEYRWLFVPDKRAFRETMVDLLERPFDTLVMAHGEVSHDGNSALRTAVQWALPE